jgi:hypothetical protein
MSYNTETINVQFLNQSFLDKVDQGMTKEAGAAMSAFVRQKLREDGFTRKILNPVMITASELDRQLTEEPTVIVEKEPDSIAASMPFLGRGEIRYFKGERYPVTFQKISSATFKKSKFELASYRTDIRTILQENSVKDIQAQEDAGFIANITAIATANSNVATITGGFTIPNLMNGVKKLLAKKLPVGCILMSQAMYADLMAQPATVIGSQSSGEFFRGQASLDNFYGYKIITTNKTELVPVNQAIIFAPQEYLGQFYSLQEPTVFLKTEADMIEFFTYEAVGSGVGNVNGMVICNFVA